MTLKQWQANGWLKPHTTSYQEIDNLLDIVRRDLADARRSDLSDDWRFGIAYNAALKLCTILLYAEGYRPAHNLAHYRTLQALPLILGNDRKDAMPCTWMPAEPSATRLSTVAWAVQQKPTRMS